MARATASIVNAWYQVMDIAKAGTSGQDSMDEFNRRVDAVQKTLAELLINVSEENQKVTDALDWLKKDSGALTSGAFGIVVLPDDYLHLDTCEIQISGVWEAATKLGTNSIAMTRTSPIRNDGSNYYFKANNMYVLPEVAAVPVRFIYFKEVPAASITLTPVSDDTGDYETPTVGVEFGWPTSMFNLLVYMLLEKYGISVKERLLYEFAQYGINEEMIKAKPTDFTDYDRDINNRRVYA